MRLRRRFIHWLQQRAQMIAMLVSAAGPKSIGFSLIDSILFKEVKVNLQIFVAFQYC